MDLSYICALLHEGFSFPRESAIVVSMFPCGCSSNGIIEAMKIHTVQFHTWVF